MNKSQQKPTAIPKDYENNPFFVATKGLELLFSKAKPIAILFAIVSGISILGGGFRTSFSGNGNPPAIEQGDIARQFATIPSGVIIAFIVLIVLVVLLSVFIGIVLRGVSDYASSELSRGREVEFTDALKAIFQNFWGYLLVQIIVSVKLFLWSILLIIPGFIMSYRYSLAGVAYFDAKKTGNSAVKESLALTKGAFLTVFASQTLFNLISLGVIQKLLSPGTNAILYRQLRSLKQAQKPQAHSASLWTLVGLIALFGFMLVFVTLFAILVASANPT